jgi:2-methylcitrate dehydratase PrpD
MTLLADIVARLSRIETLPAPVSQVALLHLTDAIGVGHAAAGTAIGAPWRRHGAAVATGGVASVFGQPQGAAPADAALVNGGLIHSLEYDDTHTGSIVHGSAVLAPAALAAAEQAGASGAALLRSYALWYEVMIRIGMAAAGGFQNRGFQLTSVGGALCAAGVAADLRGLDAAGQINAIGIALSQASGVFEFLTNGSTVKSMHPGWAAHAGLIAADLAAAGITGPHTALEGRFGLFRVFAGDEGAAARMATLLQDLGEVWHLERAAYKFYPCCHYIHPFVEAADRLAAQGLAEDTVDWIEFGVPAGAASIICDPWEAKVTAEGHAARWSLPVAVAMRLVDGAVTLDSFDRPATAGVHALAARTRWSVLDDSRFPERFDANIRAGLRDGRVLGLRIDDVYGNASRPPAAADLTAKFTGNLARLASSAQADALRRELDGLPCAKDLHGLSAALRAISGKA